VDLYFANLTELASFHENSNSFTRRSQFKRSPFMRETANFDSLVAMTDESVEKQAQNGFDFFFFDRLADQEVNAESVSKGAKGGFRGESRYRQFDPCAAIDFIENSAGCGEGFGLQSGPNFISR